MRYVLQQYGRFIAQFEMFIGLLVEIVEDINYIDKRDWPKYRSVQFILRVQNLKTLESIFNRLTRGSYEDALILIRCHQRIEVGPHDRGTAPGGEPQGSLAVGVRTMRR